MKKRRSKWIVILLVIVAALVGWKLLFGNSAQQLYAETTAQTGSITTYYSFSGSLDVNNSTLVTAPAAATVSEVYVTANGHVAKNARLMRLSDGTLLKAEIAGEVTALNVSVGSVASAGQTLAEIMDLSTMKATFKVDEYDVSAISLGKMTQITMDGSGNTFQAAVTALNKRATTEGDLSYYTATVNLTGVALPADALPGMQITVKVLNQNVLNVVVLPMDTISFTAQNEPYVLMRQDGKVVAVPIEVGANNGDVAEVTSGLNSGDTVLYTPTAAQSMQALMQRRQQSLAQDVQ